jgi:predicted RNase H-like nuclease
MHRMTLPDGLRCIGIDLAWSTTGGRPSGVAALEAGPDGLDVLEVDGVVPDDAIVAFVERHLGPATVIMVDAPLRVPNERGKRDCEILVTRRYGGRQGGAHSSNRALFARYGGVRGEALVHRLASLGVREGPLSAAGTGHHVYECYPHAAMLELFALPRTLKYKKKRQSWDEARAAFRAVLAHLDALRAPRLRLDDALRTALEPGTSVGATYKSKEDRADALLCAYLGALAVLGRLEMLGSVDAGHIVVPKPECLGA